MFRILRRLALFVAIALLLPFIGEICFRETEENTDESVSSSLATGTQTEENWAYTPSAVSAMWLSQFDLSPILLSEGRQREESDFRARVKRMMKNISKSGFNTVFLQARPNGDSLYPSALFPSSPYATGAIDTPFLYDPFDILVELAHKEGLSVHAWINPLRLYTKENEQRIRKDYLHTAFCREDSDRASLVNGVYYLNPIYPEVRTLVAEGANELLSRYPVDGLHIDDYFYPTTDKSFDEASYRLYGEGRTLGDARRDAVNALLKELYEVTHKEECGRLFGVSPSGNLKRNYEELFADVEEWCSREGYLDYLCPQVYFGLSHETHPFERVTDEFCSLIRVDSIRLYIGMTLAKASDGYYGREDPYAGKGSKEWILHRDILSRSLKYCQSLPKMDGVAFFSYRFFFSPEDGSPIAATAEERENMTQDLRKIMETKESKNYFHFFQKNS